MLSLFKLLLNKIGIRNQLNIKLYNDGITKEQRDNWLKEENRKLYNGKTEEEYDNWLKEQNRQLDLDRKKYPEKYPGLMRIMVYGPSNVILS